MKVKVSEETGELTAISFVNGVLIGIDESSVDDYDDQDPDVQDVQPRKRLKKDPEDNLGPAVAFLDTDRIEKEVDFGEIRRKIEMVLDANRWTMEDFFRADEVLADFCLHYDYTLPNFIRLMLEHMPESIDFEFIRNTIKPVVSTLRKMKREYDNDTTDEAEFRRIFDYL